jgi:UDPglucose 6-dehydrogenase
MDAPMKITIAGTGYVGLITGLCLAHKGHEVTCFDPDEKKIASLRKGCPPIYEMGVATLMESCWEKLTYTADFASAYLVSQVVFICVGTPERGDGYANLKYVYEAARQIVECVENDCVVVVKSTVPIGTNDKLEKFMNGLVKTGIRIRVAANPEFLSQGTAIDDMLHGPRIVLGVEDAESEKVMREVYRGFDAPLVITDRRSAEMIF